MSDRKDDAQKQFAKLQRAEDGKKAMAEYEAEAVALRAKTARLRALRLAREAEVAAAAPVAPVKKKAAEGRRAPRGRRGPRGRRRPRPPRGACRTGSTRAKEAATRIEAARHRRVGRAQRNPSSTTPPGRYCPT